MEKRPSRLERLRAEKEKYPFLYGKSVSPVKKKEAPAKALSEKAASAIADALRLMLNDKKP